MANDPWVERKNAKARKRDLKVLNKIRDVLFETIRAIDEAREYAGYEEFPDALANAASKLPYREDLK